MNLKPMGSSGGALKFGLDNALPVLEYPRKMPWIPPPTGFAYHLLLIVRPLSAYIRCDDLVRYKHAPQVSRHRV